MNIEIVAFYETERNDQKEFLSGTFHIRLVDLGINLRGVYLSKRKDKWFFGLSRRNAKNHNGDPVTYQIFSFVDKEQTKVLHSMIQEKGKAFITEYLKTSLVASEAQTTAEATQPPITEQKPDTSESVQKKPSLIEASPTQKKKFGNIATLAKKEYVDLPARKTSSNKERAFAKK